MASLSPGGVTEFGVKRHYKNVEIIYFALTDPGTGAPYTGGTLNGGVDAGVQTINCTLYYPNGDTFNKASGAPSLTLTLGGAGYYRLALYGETQTGGFDLDLKMMGTMGILISPTVAQFTPVYGEFDVRPDFDVQCAVTYVPGASGADQITGCISVHRWWSHEFMAMPITATGQGTGRATLSNMALKITDKDSASNSVNITGTDLVENSFDGNVYFTKAITGITGARVLTGHLTFDYKFSGSGSSAYTFHKDILIPSRFGA